MYTKEYKYTKLLTPVTKININIDKLSIYKPQVVKNCPITTQFTKGTYNGVKLNPITIKDQRDVQKEIINAKEVSIATPFVPNLKPKKPEQILLNKGKNTIKLIIDFYIINFYVKFYQVIIYIYIYMKDNPKLQTLKN